MQPPLRGSPRPEPRTADHRCGAFFRNKLRDDRIHSIAGHRHRPPCKGWSRIQAWEALGEFPLQRALILPPSPSASGGAPCAKSAPGASTSVGGGSALGSVSVGADFNGSVDTTGRKASPNGPPKALPQPTIAAPAPQQARAAPAMLMLRVFVPRQEPRNDTSLTQRRHAESPIFEPQRRGFRAVMKTIQGGLMHNRLKWGLLLSASAFALVLSASPITPSFAASASAQSDSHSTAGGSAAGTSSHSEAHGTGAGASASANGGASAHTDDGDGATAEFLGVDGCHCGRRDRSDDRRRYDRRRHGRRLYRCRFRSCPRHPRLSRGGGKSRDRRGRCHCLRLGSRRRHD